MPLSSMTGFARADGGDAAFGWTWEARSVNGKGLDVRCRLPAGWDALEAEARQAAQDRFQRGSLSLTLTVTGGADNQKVRVNEALLDSLVAECETWHARHPWLAAPGLEGLLGIRGVVEVVPAPPGEETARARREGILATLAEALDALADARAQEGARLEGIVRDHVDRIGALVGQARREAQGETERRRARLHEQVSELLSGETPLPEERVAQEAALLAARSDVREELDRLDAHVAATRGLLDEGGAVGRRLDFLGQEFNREANTLCSKAADVGLSRTGMEMKAAADQFREQVQNIE